MSVHHKTMQDLLDMGIHPELAKAAAKRFENADAAVNWCFGDGANWTPEDDMPPSRPVPPPPSSGPPPPNITLPGTTVEHREVSQNQSDTSSTHTLLDVRSPPLPPRTRPLPSPGRQSPLPLGDKNPFRNSLALDTNNPFLQANDADSDRPVVSQVSSNAEPQGAEAQNMDVDRTNDTDNQEDQWDLEARKVRTSGPPPSPTLEAQNGGTTTTFGPTNKTDTDDSMAVAPFDWDKFPQQNTSPHRSKEDEEMEKAIADSLMTASFHSAASAPRDEDLPRQVSRQPGTPLVMYSPSGQTAFASVLQGLMAIPRFRQVIMEAHSTSNSSDADPSVEQLRRIAIATEDLDNSFVDVDRCVKQLEPNKVGKQLPPIPPTRELALRLDDVTQTALRQYRNDQYAEWEAKNLPRPLELLSCGISTLSTPATFVTFNRDQHPYDIHSHMARVLWNEESNGTINQLPDILTVYLGWSASAKREIWKLDQELVMDRYMTKNAAWAVNVRAMQSVAEGTARRLKEKIETLTKHNDNDIATTMTNTIKYYEAYPGKDEVERQHRSELRVKLEQIYDKLQTQVVELKKQLEDVEHEVNGGLFETDDPKLNQHVYRLRAVLYHDGALLGTRHLYMYLLGEGDQWWRIQEHEAVKVDWSDVASDSTGMYMDGGAYCLLYERTSPRPEPYGSQVNRQQQEDQVQASQMTDGSLSQASTLVPSAPSTQVDMSETDPPSAPAPSAPMQEDLLGDEPDASFSSQSTAKVPEHRPLPEPPVPTAQIQGDQPDRQSDQDVKMSP